MSELTDALEGLRQLQRQSKWILYADAILKELEAAEAKLSQARNSYDATVAQHASILEATAAAQQHFDEVRRRENESARAADAAHQKREQAEALATESLDKANAIAKALHDEFVASLNEQLAVAQDAHQASLDKLNQEIDLLLEKKAAIEADIADLTKKWS